MQNIQNKLEVLFDKNLTVVEKRIPFDNSTIKYLENINGVEFVDPAYQGMILLNHGNKSEITNAIAANFTNLKNIIPDFNINNQISNESSMNKRIIILPQKTSESLSLLNKKGGKGNDDIITVQNIKESTNPSSSILK